MRIISLITLVPALAFSNPANEVGSLEKVTSSQFLGTSLRSPRLIILNSDVLLPKCSPSPEEIRSARKTIKTLAADSTNSVHIISARSFESLKYYRDIDGVTLVAESRGVSRRKGQEVGRNLTPHNSQLKKGSIKNTILFFLRKRYTRLHYVENLLNIKDFESGFFFGGAEADEGLHQMMNEKRIGSNDGQFFSVIVSNNPNKKTHAQFKLDTGHEVINLLNRHYVNTSPLILFHDTFL